MMRPLSKEEETEAEVTWEDQNHINTFSKLHNKLQDLQEVLSDKNVQPFPNSGTLANGAMIDTSRVINRCLARTGVGVVR